MTGPVARRAALRRLHRVAPRAGHGRGGAVLDSPARRRRPAPASWDPPLLWTALLDGPALDGPATERAVEVAERARLPTGVSEQLQALAARCQVTLNTVLQAAWAPAAEPPDRPRRHSVRDDNLGTPGGSARRRVHGRAADQHAPAAPARAWRHGDRPLAAAGAARATRSTSVRVHAPGPRTPVGRRPGKPAAVRQRGGVRELPGPDGRHPGPGRPARRARQLLREDQRAADRRGLGRRSDHAAPAVPPAPVRRRQDQPHRRVAGDDTAALRRPPVGSRRGRHRARRRRNRADAAPVE